MLQYGSKIDSYIRIIEQSNQDIYLLSFPNEEKVNIIVIIILENKRYSLFFMKFLNEKKKKIIKKMILKINLQVSQNYHFYDLNFQNDLKTYINMKRKKGNRGEE